MKAFITLDETEFATVEVERKGATRKIKTDLYQLAEMIKESANVEFETPVDFSTSKASVVSPALPPGTVKYAKMEDDSDMIMIAVSSDNYDIEYAKTLFKDIPMPNLLFTFHLKNKRMATPYVAAYKDRFLRDDTQLYRFPYANVFADTKMCFYDDQVIHDLVQLQTFVHNWMATPMNNHLYSLSEPNPVNLSKMELRQLLEESQGKPFDNDMLQPISHTFESYVDKIIKKEK